MNFGICGQFAYFFSKLSGFYYADMKYDVFGVYLVTYIKSYIHKDSRS